MSRLKHTPQLRSHSVISCGTHYQISMERISSTATLWRIGFIFPLRLILHSISDLSGVRKKLPYHVKVFTISIFRGRSSCPILYGKRGSYGISSTSLFHGLAKGSLTQYLAHQPLSQYCKNHQTTYLKKQVCFRKCLFRLKAHIP